MLALIISPLGRIVITVAVALLMTGSAYMKGRYDGRSIATTEALEAATKADAERRKIDADISGRRAADLCRSIGLPGDKIADCVRRLEQANP